MTEQKFTINRAERALVVTGTLTVIMDDDHRAGGSLIAHVVKELTALGYRVEPITPAQTT